MSRFIKFSLAVLMTVGGTSVLRAQGGWGPFSLVLSEGMTEQEAINAVGYSPNKAELSTCGSESVGGAWNCRILTWGDRYNYMRVYERRSGGLWVLNNWSVYP